MPKNCGSLIYTVLGALQLDSLVPAWHRSGRVLFLDEVHQGAEGNDPRMLALIQLLKRSGVPCVLATGTPDKAWAQAVGAGRIYTSAASAWRAPAAGSEPARTRVTLRHIYTPKALVCTRPLCWESVIPFCAAAG